ncbi:MAG: sigma factor, partial [Candidatus Latescibacteria bacterium]|nr:sigma factor [Candidatus Latescibacterota bacterium]
RDLRKTHPLSREEEGRLATRIRKGDLEARNRLVTANLRFAVDVAKRYQGRGVPLEDLISVANLGLIEAAKRFDGVSVCVLLLMRSGGYAGIFSKRWAKRAILSICPAM